MHYCRFSAMPVGRFVLDVHGESEATWPASDALCAALQVINHLQDCKKDYRQIDRVYVPLDALAREGVSVEELGADKASPALRRCLHGLAERTSALLDEAAPFSAQIADLRLAVEVAAIHRLARRLTGLLLTRDPLSERVRLGKAGAALAATVGIGGALLQRIKDARA
jgi:phytoene/squalene synthetase